MPQTEGKNKIPYHRCFKTKILVYIDRHFSNNSFFKNNLIVSAFWKSVVRLVSLAF